MVASKVLRYLSHTAVLLAVLLAPLTHAPTRAEASTTAPITYVQWNVHSTWISPGYAAENYVDQYTRSNMVNGACRTGTKCIIIREGQLCCNHYDWTVYAAHSYYVSTDRVWVTLDPSYRSQPDWKQRRMLAHVFGHANGIWWHGKHCNNLMWYQLYCSPAVYPAWRFTAPMIDRLRVN